MDKASYKFGVRTTNDILFLICLKRLQRAVVARRVDGRT